MDEYALGIEISEDRRHTSVVAAEAVEGDVVLVDLRGYVDGPDATGVVLVLLEERKTQTSHEDLLPDRKLRAVAVDPHSAAATLIKPLTHPLRNAGVKLLLPSTSDVVVARRLSRHAVGRPVAARRPGRADSGGTRRNTTPDGRRGGMGSAW